MFLGSSWHQTTSACLKRDSSFNKAFAGKG